MYNFIIITNRETSYIDDTIKILHETKDYDDKIVLLNYHYRHLKYRTHKLPIEYKQSHINRYATINRYIKTINNENIVIIENDVSIGRNFVKKLKEQWNPGTLGILSTKKRDITSGYTKDDTRSTGSLSENNIDNMNIVFSTTHIRNISNSLKNLVGIANKFNVPLSFLKDVSVTKNCDNLESLRYDYTVIIPSKDYPYVDQVKAFFNVKDIRIVDFTPVLFSRYINNIITRAKTNHIIIINPTSSVFNNNDIDTIDQKYDKKSIMVYNNDDRFCITDDSWVVFQRSHYKQTTKTFDSVLSFMQNLIDNNIPKMYVKAEGGSEYALPETFEIDPYIPNESKKSNNIFSIIIPFMYNGDRYPLFEASIERLHKYTKDYKNIEIIVHETSPSRFISNKFIKKYDINYMYSKWDNLFHRAWNLNVPAKHIAKGDVFVFFDADLLIDEKWVKELLNCDKNQYYIGWDRITYLNEEGTNHYLKNKVILSSQMERINKPSITGSGANGGINVIPRKMFFEIGGWPEDYNGLGYGGEDNSFYFKIDKLIGSTKVFKSRIFHLYHSHNTERKQERMPIFKNHSLFDKQKWYKHLSNNYKWGVHPDIKDDYVNHTLLYSFKNLKEPVLTICIVNYHRYDILLKALSRYVDMKANINMILWVNDCKAMPANIKKQVENLVGKFNKNYIFWCEENMGTGYPRFMMFNKVHYEWKTPYVMATDDDVIYDNHDELLLGATVLHQDEYKNYGAIGMWCDPLSLVVKKIMDQTYTTEFATKQSDIIDTKLLGAATMTIRREVFEYCNTDPKYIVGFVDWDFSMQIEANEWKLGLICNPDYKPKNIYKESNNAYKSMRYKQDVISASKERFNKKWGIKFVK